MDQILEMISGGGQPQEVGSIHSGGYTRLNSLVGNFQEAIHVDTGEKVLLKTVDISKVDQKALAREIKIWSELDEINIAYLYEVTVQESFLSIVLEHCNTNLEDFIRNGDLVDERFACNLFCQIVSVASSLHENDISHLGLFPDNILINYNQSLKLCSFENARKFDSYESIKQNYTSIDKTCPESLDEKAFFPKQADMWTLGVTLYFILTKTYPFEYAADDPSLPSKVANADIVLPRYLSHDAKHLLMSLLNKSPTSRFTIEQLMGSPWITNNSPEDFPTTMKSTEINTAAIIKMSANLKVDKQFHKTMIDSLMENNKNWLTTKYIFCNSASSFSITSFATRMDLGG